MRPYDFIGIGIGPFNLGLACLTQPLNDVCCLFIDQKAGFDWHPGMMLESATLQTPFMSDLVTLASPTHPLSFKLYQATGADLLLLYSGKFFLLRKEYNQYCQWAVEQLPNLRFNTQVDDIHYDEDTALYRLYCSDTCSGSRHEFLCKKLVLGTGPRHIYPNVANLLFSK